MSLPRLLSIAPLCLCLALLLSACAAPQKPPSAALSASPAAPAAPEAPLTDAQKAGFLGPVSVVTWETAVLEQKGDTVQEGPKRYTRTLRFNKDGRLMEDSTFADRTLLKYDSLGQLISRRHFRTGALKSSTAYFFDEQGRAVLDETKDANGALLSAVSYRYGAGGQLEEKTARAPTGELQKTWSFLYDQQGRVLEEVAYAYDPGPEGGGKRFEYRSVFGYDEQGRKIREELSTMPGEPDTLTRYAYGPSGALKELSEETYLPPQKAVVSRRTDHYDPSGYLTRTEEEMYDPQGSPSRSSVTMYQYEFDAQGNWKRQATSVTAGGQEPKPVQAIYRTISYHQEGEKP